MRARRPGMAADDTRANRSRPARVEHHVPRMLRRVARLAALAALLPAGSAAAATARLTPSAAPPGTRVLVQGSGLERNQGVSVRLAGRTLAFVVADANGAFTAPVPLPPDLRPGNKPVRVQAGDVVLRPALRVVGGP